MKNFQPDKGPECMKPLANNYVGNRVLKLNVGFLLNAGPGYSHDTVFDTPAVRIADDVFVTAITGSIRLSRTKEGILVQGNLQIGIEDECYRCLDSIKRDFNVRIEELYGYPISAGAEFSIHDDAILDLSPLLRAELLILTSRGMLCRPDCKGLCPECGTNLNHSTCSCGLENIDPRLAELKKLMDRK